MLGIPYSQNLIDEDDLEHIIVCYLLQQIKAGRPSVKLSELFTVCGSEFDPNQDIDRDLPLDLMDSGAIARYRNKTRH